MWAIQRTRFFAFCIYILGTCVWPDGKKYEGTWSQNMMHGKGTFYFSDGKKYVGDYVKDVKEGLGTMLW